MKLLCKMTSISIKHLNLFLNFITFFNFSGSTNTEVTVTREGNYTISSLDFMEEINIFKGIGFNSKTIT